MKVLMIAPQPFFEPRGTPISVFQRLQGLSKLGYEVDLVTYHIGKDVDFPGVNIHRTINVPFISRVKIGPSLVKLLLDVLILLKAISMLLTRRYDVIHSHEEASFFAALLAKIFRTRHIYDMHSSLPKQLENFSFGNSWPCIKLFELLEKWVIHTCDAVITIGKDLEEYVYQVKPNAKHIRIENIPIAVEGNNNSLATAQELRTKLGLENRLAVVYTGTFEGYQGLDLLLDSAKIVSQQTPDVSFVMVGGKPHQVAHWQDEANRRNLGQNVIFTGTVPLAESLVYLELADILVSPRTEGLSIPLKIYSYLHSGKPTVATNIFAHTQLLTDDVAVLTDTTAPSFSNGLLQMIQNPVSRQTTGQKAKDFVAKNFNLENYLTKMEFVYRQAVQGKPSAAFAAVTELKPRTSRDLA